MLLPHDFQQALRWLACRNIGYVNIPAFHAMAVTGVYADGTLKVVNSSPPSRSTNPYERPLYVNEIWNGPLSLISAVVSADHPEVESPQEFGEGTMDYPCRVERQTYPAVYNQIIARGQN